MAIKKHKNRLTVIIPTLSNIKGLKYLVKFLTQHHLPTIIVDNQPTSAKKKLCQHRLITYLPQTQNQGFAIAVNLAFKHVKTPWTLILNDDIEFPDDKVLANLLAVAKKNHWDAISPVLQKPTGATENLGYFVQKRGRVTLNYNPQKINQLDGITAACLLIKTNVFRDLGGFDERFFAYLEDVDLFIRMKRKGYKFGIANNIEVIHNHMTTSSKMGNFKQKMDLRNWIFLIIKNWSLQDKILYFLIIFFERLRNLSGYLKATWKTYRLKSFYLVPKELFLISRDIIAFSFRARLGQEIAFI